MAREFVFISYSWTDGKAMAERIYQDLRENDVPVWRDQQDLNPYQDFSAMIENAIKQASHILVLLSPSIITDDDSFVRREILYAQGCQKPIIPLLLPGFPGGKIPTLVNHLTWIDFEDYEAGLERLLKRLQRSSLADPFRSHVEQLNTYVIEELRRTVYRSQVMSLRVVDMPDAVLRNRPAAYQSRRPGWFVNDETRREFNDCTEAVMHYDGRMLLLGEAGAGKTTTLLTLARHQVNERLMDAGDWLPVYAPIHTWDGESMLVDWLARVTGLAAHDLSAQIDAGNVLLLLDGLDELPGNLPSEAGDEGRDLRVAFVQALDQIESARVVISCRGRGYAEIVQKTGTRIALNGAVTLKPLNDEQIETYLQDQPELWKALQDDHQLFNIARTPLVLTLLTVAYQDAGQSALQNLGDNTALLRDQVFKTYVMRRYEFEQSWSNQPLPYALADIYTLLGQVALTSLLWGKENEIGVAVFHHVIGEKVDDFIELSQGLHLLRSVRQGVFSFIHALLRDHFAFPYCIACLQDANEAVRHGAALALAKMADTRAVEPLILALRDESDGMRKLAALALGQIGDSRAITALVNTLHDRDKWVRGEAALSLGKIDDPAAVEPLLTALRDRSEYVRRHAAMALGQLRDLRALEPLIAALGDSNEGVRRHATDALGELGETAVEVLIGALHERDALVRRGAAATLGMIADNRAIDSLAEALRDKDTGVQTAAAWALQQLGDERGTTFLDTTFSDWNQPRDGGSE